MRLPAFIHCRTILWLTWLSKAHRALATLVTRQNLLVLPHRSLKTENDLKFPLTAVSNCQKPTGLSSLISLLSMKRPHVGPTLRTPSLRTFSVPWQCSLSHTLVCIATHTRAHRRTFLPQDSSCLGSIVATSQYTTDTQFSLPKG